MREMDRQTLERLGVHDLSGWPRDARSVGYGSGTARVRLGCGWREAGVRRMGEKKPAISGGFFVASKRALRRTPVPGLTAA